MKIRAAVLNAIGAKPPFAETKPLTIEELELAGPGHGEVLVKIAAAGLCHSDLSVINGDRPRPMPMALGHEAAGVVEALGEGVTDLKRGDHVVLVFVPSCGHCLPCAEGRPALCEPGAAANGAGTLLSGARLIAQERPADQSPPRLLVVRRIRDGVAPLAGQDRSGTAARRGGALRLRGAHRRRRRGQHRAGARRRVDRRHRPRRRRARVGARRARGGRAAHRRDRPVRRQARAREVAGRDAHVQRRQSGLPWNRCAKRPAAASNTRSSSRDRCARSSSPTRSPVAAAPR